MRNSNQVEVEEIHEVSFEEVSDNVTYWINLKTDKVFKMKSDKKPKGKVKQIDFSLFKKMSESESMESKDIFGDEDDVAVTAVEAYLNKDVKPFDLSGFPTEEEIKRMSVNSDLLMKELTESLLDKQRANMNNTMVESLNSLVFEAKNLDPASVNKKGVAGLFLKVVKAKEKFFTRYDTVKSKINALTEVLEKEKDKQISLIVNIEALEKVNEDYARKTNEELKEVVKVLDFMKEQVDKWPEAKTQEEAQILNKVSKRIHLLEKREMDLNGFLALSAQMMPEISGLRDNADVLINNFDDLVGKVVPAYTLNFAKFVMAHQQTKAITMQEKTISAFNEAVRDGSRQTMHNTIQVEKLKHKPLVEIETLREVHNNLVSTSLAVSEVIKESKNKRDRYLETVDNIGHSLIEMSKKSNKV